MHENEFHRVARDGTDLLLREWLPEGKIDSVVCLVHGLGDHSGCFKNLTDFLTESSIAVLGVDLHGNGKSGGQRGHVASIEVFMKDIDILMQEAGKRFPGKAVFLYGHSMGGNLVLNYLLRRKPRLAGCIAGSPWLALAGDSRKMVIGAHLISVVRPTPTLDTGINPPALSHDPIFVQTYASDPLVHGLISANLLARLSDAGSWALRMASKVDTPTLVMHSPADTLTSFDASRSFVKAADPRFVELKVWEGAFHSLHNEVNRGEIFAYLLQWMQAAQSPAGRHCAAHQ